MVVVPIVVIVTVIVAIMAAVAIVVLVMIFDVGDIAFQLVKVFFRALRRSGGVLGLFAEQRFAVFLRNLVIVGVDFAERKEAVAIAAIFVLRRLKRRFDEG